MEVLLMATDITNAQTWIKKTPGVCGGDACIRNTRITVNGLVEWRKLGLSDERILEIIEGLTPDDLAAAWQYYADHSQEIDQSIWENAACMFQHEEATTIPQQDSWIQKTPDEAGGQACVRTTGIPVWFLVQGRQLGLTDERIRDAFDAPLPQADLDAAWTYYDEHQGEIDAALHEQPKD
jgi:uncharacterized protein (DUF433 family)